MNQKKSRKIIVGIFMAFCVILMGCSDTSSDNVSSEDDISTDNTSNTPEGMVLVSAGPFQMGSNEVEDEQPMREVTLSAFYIDETEVTNGAYRECVDAGGCSFTVPPDWDPANFDEDSKYLTWYSSSNDYPMNGVSWYNANDYCAWAGKRLPTEAEWEKAARSTDGRAYPWGNQEPNCAFAIMDDGGPSCGKSDAPYVMSVGSRPDGKSRYGALDMAGNVSEWTADWYIASYYSLGPSQDPQGPPDSGPDLRKVRRGGNASATSDCTNNGTYHSSFCLKTTTRVFNSPDYQSGGVGFRCAKSAQ